MEVRETIRNFFMEEFKSNGFHAGIRFGIVVDEDKLRPKNFESIKALSKFVKNNRKF